MISAKLLFIYSDNPSCFIVIALFVEFLLFFYLTRMVFIHYIRGGLQANTSDEFDSLGFRPNHLFKTAFCLTLLIRIAIQEVAWKL